MRVLLLVIAALFAFLFLASFVPGMEKQLANLFFWIGQGGLAVCLIVLLALGTNRKR